MTADGLTIEKIDPSGKPFAEFLAYPRHCYRNDKLWVPIPDFVMRPYFDTKKNPFYKNRASLQIFLARRAGEVVGCIAAFDDATHNSYHKENTAFFGYLEAEEEAVFAALLRAAEEWARDRGRDAIRGPISTTMEDGAGFVFETIEEPATLGLHYNHLFYNDYVSRAGYGKLKDLYAWHFSFKQNGLDRLSRIAERVEKNMGDRMQVERLRFWNVKSGLRHLFEAYNESWSGNWGFVPRSREEFDWMLSHLSDAVLPEGTCLVKVDGEIVAGAVAIKDMNQVFKAIDGKLLPFGWWHLLMAAFFSKGIGKARLALMGTRHEYRRRGLDALMVRNVILWNMDTQMNLQELDGTECSWTLEDNHAVNRTIEIAGGDIVKKYRIYSRDLT